jgi:hypothetical protein
MNGQINQLVNGKSVAFYVHEGRIYDNSGQEYDKDYKPLLRRSPEMQAKLARMKEEAIARSHNVVMKKEDRVKQEEVADLRAKIDGLKEANHHAGCRKLFYHDAIHNSEWVNLVLADCDKQIRNALKLRNKILDAQVVGELEIDRADAQIAKNSDEIETLQTRIEEIELKKKMARSPTNKPQRVSHADRVIAALAPEVRKTMEESGKLEELRKLLQIQES